MQPIVRTRARKRILVLFSTAGRSDSAGQANSAVSSPQGLDPLPSGPGDGGSRKGADTRDEPADIGRRQLLFYNFVQSQGSIGCS